MIMSEENIDPTRKDRWKKYKQDKIRWGTWSTREEYEEITAKAQECALTFNEYVRRCALGRRTIHKTDSAYINTLAKLGGLQNKIMSEINERFENREFEQIAPLVAEARKIYREINMAVRRIKKMDDEDCHDHPHNGWLEETP